jgi:prepilin-type processing-associated H-X9-DG protein
VYAADYGDQLPPHATISGKTTTTLPALLHPYLNYNGGIWRCAEDPAPESAYDGTPADSTVSGGYNWHALSPGRKGIRLDAVAEPAATVAFVDTFSYLATPGPPGGTPPVYRHEKRINVAWLDGHIKTQSPGVLEETAETENDKPLKAGIDRYVHWNTR